MSVERCEHCHAAQIPHPVFEHHYRWCPRYRAALADGRVPS